MLINSPTKTLPEVFQETHGLRVVRSIAMGDVTHFRAADKYVYACGAGKDVMLNGYWQSLVMVENLLGSGWVRISRAAVVRADMIVQGRRKEYGYEIQLRGSPEWLTVSRRLIKSIRKLEGAGHGAMAA